MMKMERKGAREQEIVEGLKVICKCRNIRKSVFQKHIRAGLVTVEELKKATGAGSGACKGKQCTPKIAELFQEVKKQRG
jgi:NAD(P)H-nitrite reductase large subunit